MVGESVVKASALQVQVAAQAESPLAQVAPRRERGTGWLCATRWRAGGKRVANSRLAQASAASANLSQAHRAEVQAGGRDAGGKGAGTRDEQRGETRAPLQPASDSTTANVRAYAELSRPDAAAIGGDSTAASPLQATSQAAARVDQVMDLQDSRAPKVLSRLNLAVDDGQGGQDMVRVGMRGTSVSAGFEMRDAATATRISARLGDLTSALERKGLEPQGFTVRHTGHAAELDAVSARATVLSTSESSATRHDDQGSARGFNRHSQDRDDQAARRQDADERRRRATTLFSLNTEDA